MPPQSGRDTSGAPYGTLAFMLAPFTVVVFLADPSLLDEPERYEEALAVLSHHERTRLATFVFEHDRRSALASRALQRCALSLYAPVPPAAWRFTRNTHGRPEIAAPPGHDLRFSVSNTRELVACAVTRARDLGVDVETVRPVVPLDVVARSFAAPERAAVAAAAPGDQPRRFTELWTLKEAYVKARGTGLTLDLAHISFDFATGAPRLELDPALDDDPAGWETISWWPTSRHAAALCVRRDPAGPLHIERRWVTELSGGS